MLYNFKKHGIFIACLQCKANLDEIVLPVSLEGHENYVVANRKPKIQK